MAGQAYHNDFFNTVMNFYAGDQVEAPNDANDSRGHDKPSYTSLDNNVLDIPPLDLGPPLVDINENTHSRVRISPMSIEAIIHPHNVEINVPSNRYIGKRDSDGNFTHPRPSTDSYHRAENEQDASTHTKRKLSEDPAQDDSGTCSSPSSHPTKRERDDDKTPAQVNHRAAKRPRFSRGPSGVSDLPPQHSDYESSSGYDFGADCRHTDPEPGSNSGRCDEDTEDHPELHFSSQGCNVIDPQMAFAEPADEEDEQ